MKVYKTKEYRIMSVTSGKLLTANEDQLITVEAADEQKAQNWKFFPEENGCYRIVSTKSKKVVDIIAGGTVNGAWVHQWETVSANSQLWKLEEDGEAVRISSLSSGKYLDVALEDNRHVQIWERGGENQLWKIDLGHQQFILQTDSFLLGKPKHRSNIFLPKICIFKPYNAVQCRHLRDGVLCLLLAQLFCSLPV